MEQRINPSPFVTDSAVAYQKDVPQNAVGAVEVHKIGGMSYKSKNLFIASQVNKTALGLTMSYSNGLIKINGTKTDGANVQSVTAPNITLPAGTYTLSCKMVGGSITPSETFEYGVYFGINKNTYSQRTTPGVATIGSVGTRVITLSEPTFISSFDITPDYSGVGTVFNDALFELQFEEGDTVTTYEEGFEGLRDASVTEVKSVGVNLYDGTFTKAFYSTDGTLTSNNGARLSDFIRIDGKSITFYDKVLQSGDALRVCAFDENKNFIERKDFGNAASYAHYKNTNAMYVRVGVFVSHYDADAMMVYFGSEELPYSPYQEHMLPIPEAVQALDGFGWGMNESVYNYIDWEKKQFVKRVEKLTLNGSNVAWTSYGNTVLYNANLMNNAKKYNNSAVYALCSDIPYTENASYLNSYFIARVSNDNGLQFNNVLAIYGLSENTSAAFNAYLAEHPMTFVYELAKPIVTDISDLITSDNLLSIQGNGTLTFENEYEYAVPSTVEYITAEATA